MRRTALMLACLTAGLVPAVAHAQSGDILPPGNSAVDQYVDPLPASDGERPLDPGSGTGTKHGGGTKHGPGASAAPANGVSDVPLPLRTQQELARHGADGFRVAGVVRDTAPHPARSGGGTGGGDLGESRVSASADVLGGAAPGGMGGWLPAVLIACTVAAIAAAVLRAR